MQGERRQKKATEATHLSLDCRRQNLELLARYPRQGRRVEVVGRGRRDAVGYGQSHMLGRRGAHDGALGTAPTLEMAARGRRAAEEEEKIAMARLARFAAAAAAAGHFFISTSPRVAGAAGDIDIVTSGGIGIFSPARTGAGVVGVVGVAAGAGGRASGRS